MLKKDDQIVKAFEETIEALPQAMKNAIGWIMENIDIANQLAEGKKMSNEEVESLIKRAKEKNDYLMLGLVLYKQSKDNEGWNKEIMP